MTYFGETPTEDGLYTVVEFLETGEFVTPAGVTEGRTLVVASGGQGGTWVGGGAGGGGVKIASAEALSGTMTVTVGESVPRATANGPGLAGNDSSFGTLTAHGGGGGGAYPTETGGAGGSGGGAAHGTAASGGAGTAGEGYDGGKGSASDSSGGGGGGGEAGHNAVTTTGGAGGDGFASDIVEEGVDVYYGGGGGGCGVPTSGTGGTGGGGLGGNTASSSEVAGNGTNGLGGGGGGGWYHSNNSHGGGGGSGCVVVRFLTPEVEPTALTIDISTDWTVGELLTRDLPTDWSVRELLAPLDRATDWAITGCLPVHDRATDWTIIGQLTRDLPTDWTIVEENRITVDAAVDWSVGTLVTKDAAFDWEVMRMPYDESVRAEFSGIDLADGVHTHVLVGTDLGAMPTAYDAVRGSTGRWRQCDVRQEFVSMAIPLLVEFTSASDLAAWIAALKTACRAGGSLVWQWSSTDPARSFTIGCSPEPQIVEDNAYILQHRAEFTLALVRWPS